MKYIDSHAHLTDLRLSGKIESLLKDLSSSFQCILNAGYNQKDWQRQISIQKSAAPLKIISAWGLHPVYIADHQENPSLLLQEFDYLLKNESYYRAIGETGLDHRKAYKNSSTLQEDFFRMHLECSLNQNKALILHIVHSHQASLSILKAYSGLRGIVHSFSGNLEQAKEYHKLGFLISFSPSICHPGRTKLTETLSWIPLESLLIESDSPDQKPPQWASEWNTPFSIVDVAQKIADVKKISLEKVLTNCNQNFCHLFPEEF